MQITRKQLLRQQVILKGLDFYQGPLDGIWGPQSIAAMKKFERRPDMYRPARPVNGLPFGDQPPYPRGIVRIPGEGLLYHPCVDNLAREEKEAFDIIEGRRPASSAVAPPTAQVEANIEQESVEEVSKEVEQAPAGDRHRKSNR